LQNDRTARHAGRLHDGLYLFHVVNVEGRQAVAVFGSVVEELAHRNERHRTSPWKWPHVWPVEGAVSMARIVCLTRWDVRPNSTNSSFSLAHSPKPSSPITVPL